MNLDITHNADEGLSNTEYDVSSLDIFQNKEPASGTGDGGGGDLERYGGIDSSGKRFGRVVGHCQLRHAQGRDGFLRGRHCIRSTCAFLLQGKMGVAGSQASVDVERILERSKSLSKVDRVPPLAGKIQYK